MERQDENPKIVAETVQHFITLMDALKVNMVAVDELLPYLTDLMHSLDKCPSVLKDPIIKQKVKTWHDTVGQMQASEELNEGQVRQFLFDLDSAYSSFHRTLK